MTDLAQHCLKVLALDPGGEAVEFNDRWYTWGEMRQQAEALWRAIDAAGIPKDEPITFVPRNRPSALSSLIGLLAQDRTIRMIYAFQSPAAVAKSVEKLDAAAIIMYEQDFSPEVREVMAAKGMAGIVIEDMGARLLEGFGKGTPRPKNDAAPEPSVEILTSGTTGPPKQFPLPHSVISKFLSGSGMTRKDDPNEAPMLYSFPVGNISGIHSAAASVLAGKRAVLLDRFTLEAWHKFVLKYRPRIGGAPTAAINMILDAKIPKEDLASFEYFGTGAAPLDITVHRAFEEHYGIPILLSYGATEFGGPVTMMTAELHKAFGKAKLGSVGRPLHGAKLRVVAPETREELPAGEEGMLEVVSPRMGLEWIRTSDLGVIDEDGFIWLRGRADGAIMRGGFKVLPETIERAMLLHPAISAVGVVGVADERLYQVPAAAIQLKPDVAPPTVEELKLHLRQHVLATHIPVHWKFVDALPKNRSFKIDRPGVRALFEEEAVA